MNIIDSKWTSAVLHKPFSPKRKTFFFHFFSLSIFQFLSHYLNKTISFIRNFFFLRKIRTKNVFLSKCKDLPKLKELFFFFLLCQFSQVFFLIRLYRYSFVFPFLLSIYTFSLDHNIRCHFKIHPEIKSIYSIISWFCLHQKINKWI